MLANAAAHKEKRHLVALLLVANGLCVQRWISDIADVSEAD